MYHIVESSPWSWAWMCTVFGPACAAIRLLPFILLWLVGLGMMYYMTTYHLFKLDPPDRVVDVVAFIWWASAMTFAFWPVLVGD